MLSKRVAFIQREADFKWSSAFFERLTRDLQTATRVTRDFHHNELIPLDEAETSLYDTLINSGPQRRVEATGWRRGRNKRGTNADGKSSNSQSRTLSRSAPRPDEFRRSNRMQSLLQMEDTLPTTMEQEFLFYEDEDDEQQQQMQERMMSPDDEESYGRMVYEGDEQVAGVTASPGEERGEYLYADRLAAMSSSGDSAAAPVPGISGPDPSTTRTPVRRGRDDRSFGAVVEGRSELLSEQWAENSAFSSNKLETRVVDQASGVQINMASSLFSSFGLCTIIVISIFILGV